MELLGMYQREMSQSEIARQVGLDRKMVRKYLHQPPQGYRPRPARATKHDPYRSYMRERWAQGVHKARKQFGEIQKRGYSGRYTRVRKVLAVWREAERERAFVRFETQPGEQSQLDRGHFGNWQEHPLYGFALTLGYSPGCATWILLTGRIWRRYSPAWSMPSTTWAG